MATKRMLIDATHPEETRVVVLNGSRLEDFDVEVASRKQLKGNIYLAKVTRVEPSLQAAFVDYGGNRHGFLSFNEIHPDYYQIPVGDRERILAEQQDQHESEDEPGNGKPHGHDDEGDEEHVETVGGDDSDEVEVRRPSLSNLRRQYKIQEVIKRRQILLVQVVKEERGNKGAALTTYLSLAGRYCVLMPNTARGGGISRKISSGTDRKRLKTILTELEIPQGMAVIVRTAGSERSKAEIKRDYDYLMRLWDSVRRTTLESIAPTLVYEEGNLIKRTIRDLYDRDIDEVMIDGDEGYRTGKDFMKLLIPSHVKRVKRYIDPLMPLFHRYQVENQLDEMNSPVVQLRSGGYIVINPTEALVSIDVNSGRATRERNIEETAMRTNIEAAEEIARQLRLRDLAGLIVIDFIDMEVPRNRIQVERRMKEAMRTDRARIQLGRISPFGLLEMSRQRLRPSLLETSFATCPHCLGSGLVRSVDSAALHVLRAIEEEGIRRKSGAVMVFTPLPIAMYLLNKKRAALADVEARYGITVEFSADDSLVVPNNRIEWTRAVVAEPEAETATAPVTEIPEAEPAPEQSGPESSDEESNRRRRRRRPRRRRRDDAEIESESTVEATEGEEAAETLHDEPSDEAAAENAESEPAAEADSESEDGDDAKTKRRRRGKRGGRRRRSARTTDAAVTTEAGTSEDGTPEGAPESVAAETVAETTVDTEPEDAAQVPEPSFEPAPRIETTETVTEPSAATAETTETPSEAFTEAAPPEAEAKPKPARRRRRKPKAEEAAATADATDKPVLTEPRSDETKEAPEVAKEAPKRTRTRRAPRKKKTEPAVEVPAVAEDIAPETEPQVVTGESASAPSEPVSAEPATEIPAAAEIVEPAPTEIHASSVQDVESADESVGAEPEQPEPERKPEEPDVDPLGDAIIQVSGSEPESVEPPQPKRGGWWQRLTNR